MKGCLERSLYIDIARPPEVVFDYISSPRRWHEWIPTSRRVPAHPVPLVVGRRFEEDYDAGGKLVHYSWIVKEYERPHRWVIENGSPEKGWVTFRYDFIANAIGTRFMRQLQLTDLPRPLSPESIERIDRESQAAMARIKAILESASV